MTKDTTYVASFLSSDGTYYADPRLLQRGVRRGPAARRRPAANGVYKYGGGFPTETFDATSYGADVLFAPTDQTAPQVTSVAPAGGAAGVDPGTQVAVAFDEGVDPATADSGSFFLRNEAGALVPADVTYDAAARTATLRPRAPLAWATTYTATVKGGAVGFADLAGNPLAPGPHVVVHHCGAAARVQRPRRGRHQGLAVRRAPARAPARASTGRRRAPRSASPSRRARSGLRRTGRSSCAWRVPQARASCRVQLKLLVGKRTVATKTVTVAAGKTKTVTLRLSRAARSDLKRKRSLRATAVASANGATARAPTLLLSPRRR